MWKSLASALLIFTAGLNVAKAADACNASSTMSFPSNVKYIHGVDADNSIKFQLEGCDGGDGVSGSEFYFPTGTALTGPWLSLLETALTTGQKVKVIFNFDATGNWKVNNLFLYK